MAASPQPSYYSGVGVVFTGADGERALIEWVENGTAPDAVVARHLASCVVDNERLVCAYPRVATYTGPARGRNASRNWVAAHFECR